MTTTDSRKRRQLLQQSEKILLHPIHPHLFAYCPTMDLIAVVTDEENLDVYRLNGQLAFSLKRKSEDVTVDALQWEFNGKSIAVSWSDGSTDLVNAETGKVAHKDLMLPTPTGAEDAPSRVKCIGWGLNFIDVDAVKRRTGVQKASGESDAFGQPTTEDWDAFKDDTTIEDFLQRQPDFQSLDVAPDLPDQLAMMDVEVLLPKLPAIPLPPALPFMRVSQADSGAFSSQADVDALLHSSHLRDHNSVDMFIRCSDRGTVHPSMYDSKETVNIHLPTAWGVESIPLLHTSHPYNCSHGLLMRTTLPTSGSKIAFVPLTLNFIPSAGIYLHLIASKTSQLQNLLLYITQCLQRIRTFFKHANDLPSKFMMNISETLEEKDMGNLVTNLFHIACTGNCPPLIKEWLVDELTEAGHKRWDAAVTTSLTTLLAIVHENLIPAIDRCSIIISRLRGLAEFHQDRDWIFTCALSDFSNTLDVLKCMRLLAHTVLLYAAEEKRQFNQFSKWLRFVIDFEATEPESQSRQEMETRDSGTDVMQVLEYIQFGLTNSELKPYLKPAEGKGKSESYEDTKKAVEVLKEGGGYKEDAVCLENVLGYFKESVTGLLRQVSLWQEGNIRMDGGIVLEDATTDDAVVDMRMVFEPSSSSNDITTYIAICPTPSSPTLHIHRITHSPSLSSLAKDISSYAVSTLSFPPNSRILDAKFASDSDLIVILETQSQSRTCTNTTAPEKRHQILTIPYTPFTTSASQPLLSYPPIPTPATLLPTGSPTPPSLRATISLTPESIDRHTRHIFEGRFTPLKMIVNGRKGRRVVVVLGSDRKHYRVLDLDYDGSGGRVDGESNEGDDGEEGNGEGDVEMGGG